MTSDNIAAKIAAARALEAAATPGTWFQDPDNKHWLCQIDDDFPYPDGMFLARFGGGAFDSERPADAAFTAHARNHHAALWDVVEAAQGVACHCNPPHIACGASEGMECECGAADFGAALNAMRAALAKLVEAP